MRVHSADGARDYDAGESYYWAAGHNLEAVTDTEYLEITKTEEYDDLMAHCARVMRRLGRADLELRQRHGAEGGDQRDVDRVTAAADDHAADAAAVVAGVEGVPLAVEVDLEPGGEVHRLGRERDVDLGDVAEDVAGGDVQRAAERDRQVGEVAADALAGAVGVDRRGPGVRGAGDPFEVAVDVVDDRLDAFPAGRRGRRSAATPRGRARRAGRSGWA